MVAATKGLISGVVHSAKHLGVDAEKAVSVAATGAVKAAYELVRRLGIK